jgi:hypothetical protein
MKKIALLVAVLLCFSACFAACKNNGPEELPVMTTSGAKPMDLTTITATDYVVLGQYKDNTIEYLPAQEEKGDMIWEKIFFSSTVIEYPQQQIEYYIDQIRAYYIYVAEERGDTYQEVLDMLGVTDETMLTEAQFKTKADLIKRAIIETEGIVLTEEDKANNTDKYVQKFIDDYGYAEDHIRTELMDELYDVMLEDKMMEKLILLNTFIERGFLEDGDATTDEENGGGHDHEH